MVLFVSIMSNTDDIAEISSSGSS